MELINHSPYTAAVVVDMDRNGADTLVLIVKASFDILPDGGLELSGRQRDIEWADVHCGEPGASSVLYESDATWGRTGTDVALIGYAHAQQPGDRQVDVAMRIGPLSKGARVFGDRYWEGTPVTARMTRPEPFEKIPLVWERSFGGVDTSPEDPRDHAQEPRNPVGRGFRARNSRVDLDGLRLPNVEDPQHLIANPGDRPPPLGFGFVAKSWMPRVAFAGTYDDRWQKMRAPLLPEDYDSRFTVAAAEGLWAANGITGGEVVDLVHLTPNGRLRFVLPKVDVSGSFLARVPPTNLDMHLVVILIDLVRMRLTLLWHGTQAIRPGLVDDIRWVRALDGSFHVASTT